ncbi:MAG: ribonuclease III [Bryobacteraceae bacterium]|nr:ribonuclease III [Bryobacteraceae bacterium]MDW8378755.1 ribonuclease III [Bryobacterales bacterium]
MSSDLELLESKIQHQFHDRSLLERALTHKSYRFERPGQGPGVLEDNEQLEFLGDSVLGFLVAEQLVKLYPNMSEGGLSKRKAHLVSAQRLYEVAQRLELGQFLRLGRGEELSGGRQKRALLANALEALIAALFLDGGLELARNFVQAQIVSEFAENPDGEAQVKDYKSALQERTQQLKLPTPRYSIVHEEGPEHSKVFTVEVRVGKELSSRAEGLSKKSAGQKAAQQVLERLRAMEPRPE